MKIYYKEWENKFTLQCNLVLAYDERVVLKAAEILFETIKNRTPIGDPKLWNPPYWPRDYVPGTLRDSWEFIQEGGTIIISNQQPYAYRVENGWSTQAPLGMMRISVKEFGQILDKVAKQVKL